MSVNSKMTAIADEIRVLSGATGTMGLDAMATNIADANEEVNTQGDLLSQIQNALEGKAAGGGGGSDGGSVETCTVNINIEGDVAGQTGYILYCDVDGNIGKKTLYNNTGFTGTIIMQKGLMVLTPDFHGGVLDYTTILSGSIEWANKDAKACVFMVHGDCYLTMSAGSS